MTKKVKLATALNRALDQRSAAALPARAPRARKPAASAAAQASTGLDSSPHARGGFGLPALGRALSSAVYGAGYYTSFGMVFSAMAVLHLLPIDNALGRGFADGGRAGRHAYYRRLAKSAGPRGGKPEVGAVPAA